MIYTDFELFSGYYSPDKPKVRTVIFPNLCTEVSDLNVRTDRTRTAIRLKMTPRQTAAWVTLNQSIKNCKKMFSQLRNFRNLCLCGGFIISWAIRTS